MSTKSKTRRDELWEKLASWNLDREEGALAAPAQTVEKTAACEESVEDLCAALDGLLNGDKLASDLGDQGEGGATYAKENDQGQSMNAEHTLDGSDPTALADQAPVPESKGGEGLGQDGHSVDNDEGQSMNAEHATDGDPRDAVKTAEEATAKNPQAPEGPDVPEGEAGATAKDPQDSEGEGVPEGQAGATSSNPQEAEGPSNKEATKRPALGKLAQALETDIIESYIDAVTRREIEGGADKLASVRRAAEKALDNGSHRSGSRFLEALIL